MKEIPCLVLVARIKLVAIIIHIQIVFDEKYEHEKVIPW